MKTNLGLDPDPLSIRWVLTVPAIWDENSKQFMREAAHRVILLVKAQFKRNPFFIVLT